jgi:hypothetical protein
MPTPAQQSSAGLVEARPVITPPTELSSESTERPRGCGAVPIIRLLLGLFFAISMLGCRAPLEVPSVQPAERESSLPPSVEPEPATWTDPGEFPRMDSMVLERTDVAAQVVLGMAHVRVRQSFANPEDRVLGAVYRFALPANAEVDSLHIVVGDRTIENVQFEQRPTGIFTHALAQLPPRERIDVELSYVQTLTDNEGVSEFVFPLIGELDGELSLRLDVDAGARVDHWTAPGQSLTAAATERGFTAQLGPAATGFTDDFVIRWQLAPVRPQATLYLGPADAEGHGHFALHLLAPAPDREDDRPFELIFVIDTSASLAGGPLRDATWIVREGLSRLRPTDSFNLLTFAGGAAQLFDGSQPANERNLAAAGRFLERLETSSGAHLRDAIAVGLHPALAADQLRFVVFLTDGHIARPETLVSAAADLTARAEAVGGRAHVFGVGVGSAVDEAMLTRLSEAGAGKPIFDGGDRQAVIDQIFRYINRPILAEIGIDWAGLAIDEANLDQLPDLLAGHSLTLIGRYWAAPTGNVVVRGRVPGQRQSIELPVEQVHGDESILATTWRREKPPEQDERSIYAIVRTICFVGTAPQIEYVFEPAEPPKLLPLGNADWGPDSLMRIAGVATSVDVDARAIRRAIRKRAAEFEACHEIHRSKAPKRRLRHRLHFDASAQLVAVELLDGSFGEAGEQCLADVFRRVPWQGLPAARSVVEVELRLRLR